MNYYNEWDKGAAAWLRELIKAGLIPNGYVDERSITDVTPSDLEGFTQCHFFAGVGGWPLALQLAGVPESTRLWTGSPPCQPFSVAGQSLGFDDERHLAPVLLRLIRECNPDYFFGEQVAAAIGKHWLDFVFLNLEAAGYACGADVLPACSVGAPHKRDRLVFGAALMDHASSIGRHTRRHRDNSGNDGQQPAATGEVSSMADADNTRPQGWGRMPECTNQQFAGASGVAGELADPLCQQFDGGGTSRKGWWAQSTNGSYHDAANPHHGFWSGADWLGCRDGKFRPVESGTFPLANGIPARVGRLRGYGNAIVPQVAAEFIKAFRGACGN
ncbi:DNA cytosine methyltransferase [Pantoea ananatis]